MKNVYLILIWSLCLTAMGLAQAPQIVSTTPAQNELDAQVDADISVTFDTHMDQSTINSSSFVVHAKCTGLLEGGISYDSPSKTATFNPGVDFTAGDVITVVLTDGIESSGGTPLVDYVWSFTTATIESPGVFSPHDSYATHILILYSLRTLTATAILTLP